MDYLQIANSWPVWLCAGACVAFIVVQAVAFAKLCYKNAPLVGLSKADCSKSFQCGMVTAIGPSLSCFIGAISMITVVGGPLAWMRLSMIGAAPTELTAATTGAAAYGVELGGAVKNVIALAVGIAMGLDYGDNAKAALITRGNAELSRLGIAMGCKAETFAGLSGMGDLIVTCTSMHSRNLHAGMLIGRGKSVEEAKTEVGQVVEGINALPAACRLARQYKVEMPIVQAVEAILDGKLEARSALMALMGRSLKRE